ncbi:MAG: DivIVA domain-containing protein [Bifidobacteriaceae bacterium]|jgi:DivIVA domain-containing protein|nr:DivIVA domain-containing protein [Bifidobacteriaceae bacterium]
MSLLFSKNKKSELAYNTEEVDAFFDRVQAAYDANIDSIDVLKIANTSFSLTKSGYYTREVDLAIDKLIYSILEYKKHIAYKSGQGEVWEKEYARSVWDLENVLRSEKGKFFEKGKKKSYSYKVRPVDKFMQKLKKYFLESGNKVGIDQIDKISFPSTKSGRGYSEAGVDAFLNRVRVLLIASDISTT